MILRRKRTLKKHRIKENKRLFRLGLLVFLFLLIMTPIVLITRQLSQKEKIVSPLPTLLSKLHLSSSVEDEQVRSIEKLLSDRNISYTGVTPGSEEDIIHLPDNGDVIISTEKSITEQISSLQLILTRLTMEGKHFTKLDLRFDKPVIVLQ